MQGPEAYTVYISDFPEDLDKVKEEGQAWVHPFALWLTGMEGRGA